MVDWLKLNPAFSLHDFMWNLSVPFVKVMMSDATQTLMLTEKQAKQYKQQRRTGKRSDEVTDDPDAFAAALGIPSF